MYFLPALNTIDPSLGRLDYTMLSDQACFEIFIGDCTPLQKFTLGVTSSEDDPDAYVDVCEWKGAECDAEGNVLKIRVYYLYLGNMDLYKFNFRFLPRKLSDFDFFELHCNTDLSTADLPQELRRFRFSGRIEQRWKFEAKDIPRGIHIFESESSRFEGTCDLTVLPSSINWLKLSNNLLTGAIDLNHLPETMKVLKLRNNALNGSIHITHLPERMNRLDLSWNNFSGSCTILSIPSHGFALSIDENNLSGTAVLLKRTKHTCKKHMLQFQKNRILAVRDEQGEKHPFSKWILERQRKDTE